MADSCHRLFAGHVKRGIRERLEYGDGLRIGNIETVIEVLSSGQRSLKQESYVNDINENTLNLRFHSPW